MSIPMATLQPLDALDPDVARYEVLDLDGNRRLFTGLTEAARWIEQGCPTYQPTYRAEKTLMRFVRTATGSRPDFRWVIVCNDTDERIGTFPEEDEVRAKAWAAAGCRKTNNPLTWDSWYKEKIPAEKVTPGDLIVSPWGNRHDVLEVEELHFDTFTTPGGRTVQRVRYTGWMTRAGQTLPERIEQGAGQEVGGSMYLMGDLRDVKSYE